MLKEIWTASEFIKKSNLGFLHRRNNIHLLNIDNLLKQHSELLNESPKLEANILLLICQACRTYIDQKPMGHRTATVVVLYTQAMNRAILLTTQRITGHSLGYGQQGWAKVRSALKPLLQGVAGSQGKAHHILNENYWPEMIIENHFPLTRPIGYTPSPLSVWEKSSSPLDFIDWLREFYIPDMINNDKGMALLHRLNKGVAYLSSAQREERRIHIRAGVIYNFCNERLHTGNMKTCAMGQGWAIFVMAPDNSLYANSHEVDVFHHSSFLSGAPVQSAGEIAVDNGQLVAITSKSGHYRPDSGSFVRILYWLKKHGVNLQNIAACPTSPEQVQEFFDAEELWSNGGLRGKKSLKPRRVLPTLN